MKKMVNHCIRCMVVMAVLLVLGMTGNGAARVSAEILQTVAPEREGKKASTGMDIDGDGVMNTITVSYSCDSQDKYSSDYTKTVYVEVDGKSALVLDVSDYIGYGVNLTLAESGSGDICMQLWAYSDNDYIGYNQVFRYDVSSGEFYKILDLTKGRHRYGMEIAAVTDNGIVVSFSCQPPEIGWTFWERTYVWEEGKLKPESDEDYALRYAKDYVTDRKLKFYKTVGGKEKAFTLKKGKKVSLECICVTKKKMYARFKYGKKLGWLQIDNDYEKVYKYDKNGNIKNGYFKGVWENLAG